GSRSGRSRSAYLPTMPVTRSPATDAPPSTMLRPRGGGRAVAPLENGSRPDEPLPTRLLAGGPALVAPATGGSSAVDLGRSPSTGEVYRHRAPDFIDLLQDILPDDRRTAGRLQDAA